MQKQIKITYLKKATKFLKKNTNIITEEDIDTLVILAIKKKVFDIDTNIDIKNLKGNLKGKYRIRKGDIRIIIDIQKKEVVIQSIVEAIDFRGNIYQ
jgi:mRNA-degrading endonuclease RelE of RelBE toxin-antitoxin system